MGCSAANLAIRPHSSLASLADGQKVLWECLRSQCGAPAEDTVSEWLRRWTKNPLGSARKGSYIPSVSMHVHVACPCDTNSRILRV